MCRWIYQHYLKLFRILAKIQRMFKKSWSKKEMEKTSKKGVNNVNIIVHSHTKSELPARIIAMCVHCLSTIINWFKMRILKNEKEI